MAFTEGFEYDIFISYSHIDNSAAEEKKGWVDHFHEELEAFLAIRFGTEKIKIWRDKSLHGNTLFDDHIKTVIKGSALFFALLSRHYIESEYCQKEQNWFYQNAKYDYHGLSLKNEHRLFTILLNNIPHTDWPQELVGASGFPMHDSPINSTNSGESLFPEEVKFKKGLRKIVDAVYKTLTTFPQSAINNESNSDYIEKPVRIFIADTADTLQSTKERLIADLEDKHLLVLNPIPPPMDNISHEQETTSALQNATISIHLLDELPGRKIIDVNTKTYPRRQLEIAMQTDIPKIIWVPRHLQYNQIEDQSHKTFIQTLENNPREEKKYQFVRCPKTDLSNLALEAVEQFREKNEHRLEDPTILLDTHQKDQLFAFHLAQYLGSKGLKIEFNQESNNPLISLRNFEEYLRYVRHLVIIFGKVTPAWVLGRLTKTLRLVSVEWDTFTKATLETVWIYLLPSCTITGEMKKLEKMFRINYLNNQHSSSFDKKTAEPLLAACHAER